MLDIEPWRRVFREGLAKVLTTDQLVALKDGLERDDKRLIQGATTDPPPLLSLADYKCEGGCLVSYVGFAALAEPTVGEVEAFFSKTCREIDALCGEGECRHILNHFDDNLREDVRREFIAEIDRALADDYYDEKELGVPVG